MPDALSWSREEAILKGMYALLEDEGWGGVVVVVGEGEKEKGRYIICVRARRDDLTLIHNHSNTHRGNKSLVSNKHRIQSASRLLIANNGDGDDILHSLDFGHVRTPRHFITNNDNRDWWMRNGSHRRPRNARSINTSNWKNQDTFKRLTHTAHRADKECIEFSLYQLYTYFNNP